MSDEAPAAPPTAPTLLRNAGGRVLGLAAAAVILLCVFSVLGGRRDPRVARDLGLIFVLAVPLGAALAPRAAAGAPAGRLVASTFATCAVVAAIAVARARFGELPFMPWNATRADETLAFLASGSLPAGLFLALLLATPPAVSLVLVRRRTDAILWHAAAGGAGGLLAVAATFVSAPFGPGGLVAILGVTAGALAAAALSGIDGALAGPSPARGRPGPATLALFLAVVPAGVVLGALHPSSPEEDDVVGKVHEVLQRVVAAEDAYHKKNGFYARTAGDLGVAELGSGVGVGYVFRYGTFSKSASWVVCADPIQPAPGRPSFAAGSGRSIEVSPNPFRLESRGP